MQVNKKIEKITTTEFYLDSEYIIKNHLLDKICTQDFETNVKSYIDKLCIIFKSKDILLELKLTKEILTYRISIKNSKPQMDKDYIYCRYEEVKEKENYKKYTYQLKEDIYRLIKNVIFYKEDEKESFLSDNEFKFSEDFEIPKKDRYDFI